MQKDWGQSRRNRKSLKSQQKLFQGKTILPMLLHQPDAQGTPCSCRDCTGIRLRIEQIQELQGRLPQAS